MSGWMQGMVEKSLSFIYNKHKEQLEEAHWENYF